MNRALTTLAVLIAFGRPPPEPKRSPHGSSWRPAAVTPIPARRRSPLQPCSGRSRRRERRPGGEGVTVFVREGTYYLPETLVFTAEDSGTKAAPVVYQAYREGAGGHQRRRPPERPQVGTVQGRHHAGQGARRLGHRPAFRQRRAAAHGALSQFRSATSATSTAMRRTPSARSGRRAGTTQPAGSSMPCTPPSGAACTTSSPARARTTRSPTKAAGRTTARWACTTVRFVENIFEELDAPGEWFLDAQDQHALFLSAAGR